MCARARMLASSHMRAVRACVRVVHMHVYRGWGLNSVCTEVGVFGVRAGMCSMCVCVCFAFVCGETDRDCHEVFRSVGRVEHNHNIHDITSALGLR